MNRLFVLPLFLALVSLTTTGCSGIAQRVVTNRVAENLQTNLPASLPDGLHVLVCGAGGPLADPKRSGPCVAIIAGETVVVIDSGSGAGRNLGRFGLAPSNVDALFLTHFHSDHIDGLGEVAMLRWAGSGRTSPLPVHGPAGVEEIVEGFNIAYQRPTH